MYAARITRKNPTLIVFLVDRSGSMTGPFGSDSESSKAGEVARALNRLLCELALKCSKGEDVRPYFDVAVLGYGARVEPILSGPLASREVVSITELAEHPLRMESISIRQPDLKGGYVQDFAEIPVWIEAVGDGQTPMCEALRRSRDLIRAWVVQHPESYPPTVVNISDGAFTDGDPSAVAGEIRSICTADGATVLVNINITSSTGPSLKYPHDVKQLPHEEYAHQLFRMSSVLPASILAALKEDGYPVTSESRGFVYNASLEEFIHFLNIGTLGATQRMQ